MPAERVVIYCLVPPALEKRLLEPLRRHYARDPRVRVIVERRKGDRRGAGETQLGTGDRRRNVGDRRRPVLERAIAALPPRLERHRDAIRFEQRLLPVSSELEALSDDHVVERVRLGDAEAPTELYWRCYERVYSRLSVLLGDPQRADAAVGSAFGRILDALEAAAGPVSFHQLIYSAVDSGIRRRLPDPATEPALPAGPSLAIGDPALDEPIVVAERDPRWFIRAHSERDALLRRAGEKIVAIEHIGGTALPALPARPVIDLLVGVEALPVPLGLHALLLERGYQNCGNAGTPGRAYYRRRGLAYFDLHVVEHGSALWHEPIRLREYLRRHKADAYRWASARREAARGAGDSLTLYTQRRARALAKLLASAEQESSQRAG